MAKSGKIDLTGQVAIVTGGARGIGRACVLALAREGAGVVIADLLNGEPTAQEVLGMRRKALFQRTDITKREEVEALVRVTVEAFGRIDILVNNAGTCQRLGLEELTEELWDEDLDTILRGTYLCTQAVYPHMKRQGYGKIVNVSSVSGKAGGPISRKEESPEVMKGRSGPAYAAAKGGVIAFTKWMAKDAGRYGIYVNTVAPGPINTEMTKGYVYDLSGVPLARMGEPEDVAEAILFLASNASNFITGTVLNVDGGVLMD